MFLLNINEKEVEVMAQMDKSYYRSYYLILEKEFFKDEKSMTMVYVAGQERTKVTVNDTGNQ